MWWMLAGRLRMTCRRPKKLRTTTSSSKASGGKANSAFSPSARAIARAESPSSGARAVGGNTARPSLTARIRASPNRPHRDRHRRVLSKHVFTVWPPLGAVGTKEVAFLDDAASLSTANRVVSMRLPAKVHYAWVVAAVTFVVLLLTAGVRAAPGILVVSLEKQFYLAGLAISFSGRGHL